MNPPTASLFTLAHQQEEENTLLTMTLNTPFVDTTEIPLTSEILNKYLPSIFRSKCFNDKNLPFHKEVASTEIGHLFEHILLEFLTERKRRSFKGITEWNWTRDRKGTFHITIDLLEKESKLLPEALQKSIELLALILETRLRQNNK